ncbi:MAG: response regulator transcription factor [Lachnospiraceae bacterium]|jgi:DNA-binding LytR/AlgR family response regulator|nr:response regulator transcription factor [Lachnospiraceae bacterium]
MNIAVCDDDIKTRGQLSGLIKDQFPEGIVRCFSGSEELLNDGKFYDICFLDIEMETVSGIELAKRIRKYQEVSPKRSIIIFVTAYSEYVEDAFDVNAFHYLLKPIKESKFREVLRRAINETWYAEEQRKKFIIIKDGDKRKKLMLDGIQYIESSDRKVIIHMDEGTAETYAKMYDLEKELGESFFRCHRGYIVNFEKVTSYSVNSIKVLNGDTIMIAEKKYTDFVRAYLKYAKNGGIVNV